MNLWRQLAVPSLVASLSACSSAPATPEPPPPPSQPTRATPAPSIAAPTPAASRIELAGPGFAPVLSHGTAGGPLPGQTMSPHCVGNYPTAAQHIVRVGQALSHFRVVINAGASDTTLAVRGPDGTYFCNDDSSDPANTLNPAVDVENAAPGDYQIFVGGYSGGDAWAGYGLGVIEGRAFPSEVVPAP